MKPDPEKHHGIFHYRLKSALGGIETNSGINIENEGLKQIKVGAVRIELTPVEIEANTLMFLRYFNSIPYVKASSVYEPGSFTALA